MREDECLRLDIPIEPLDETDTNIPTQADGVSPLDIIGKAKFTAEREKLSFTWEGYVSKSLQAAILCGGAFLERNDIVQELKEKRIKVANKHYIMESSPLCPPQPDMYVKTVLAAQPTSIAPGETCDIPLPQGYSPDQYYIISPPWNGPSLSWNPQLAQAVGSNLRFQNDTSNTITVGRNVPIFNISATDPKSEFSDDQSLTNQSSTLKPNIPDLSTKPARDDVLKKIEVPDNLSQNIKEKLFKINSKHIKVFDGDLSDGYNGSHGDHTVDFHFKNDIRPPVHFGCVPSYNKREDDVLMQAMIDNLEDQHIVAKANDIGIIPRYASPTMLVFKNSARTLSKEKYANLSISEKLKFHRMVLCQNKLNDYVEKIPHKYNTLEDTIRIVGSFEHVITTDLTDSFWQRHIAEDKLPYFAFHSPFRGTYIFLRSSQGFLNQSEGLENMVSCVLQDFIAEGWCRVHADNIYVMGHTQDITVSRWQLVLEAMTSSNLKLSPKKTSCFPPKLDLLGWHKEGKLLTPDPHRQNCVSITELPRTAKQLRSFIGSYRTFQRCQENTAFILKDLEQFLAANSSTSNTILPWTQDLVKQFEESKVKIKKLDKLYLPKDTDQLVLTSDWCKYGISATLWAVVDQKFLVVARMSCRIDKPNIDTLPCDGEATAHYVAAKSSTFSLPIKSSKLKTIALLDNKTVCQAANLLKKGKFSSSKIINELLVGISELNLDYQHLSGKMGQNFTDDYGSRNPVTCTGGEHCKICSFLLDCEQLPVNCAISFAATNGAIVGNISENCNNQLVNDIIRGLAPIPFSNRKAMKYLQDQDKDLQMVKRELTSGQRPQLKNTKVNSIKRYLQNQSKISISKDGLLVSQKMGRRFSSKDLIVIPESVSRGILYGLHLNLKHPTSFQLKKVVDTKFFILDKDKIIDDITCKCDLCQSLAQIPKEIETFKPNQVPDHPGMEFTVDILKYSKKLAVVATDNFSGFISTTLIQSEANEHLLEGIIITVLPFKTSSLSKVRVDQAPGFKKLSKKKIDLADVGLSMELGEAKNKNSIALVDRKMQELQTEIKKVSPSHNVLDIKILAQATSIVNERVRKSGFSAKEILFSRDQFSSENLALIDKDLADDKMEKRIKDNEYSAKSKATVNKPTSSANAKDGQLVFLKRDGDKLARRELYLVLEVVEDSSLKICKLLNTMSDNVASLQPHNVTYKVKQSDVFLAPNQPIEVLPETVEVPPDTLDITLDADILQYPPEPFTYSDYQTNPPCTKRTKQHEEDNSDDEDWYEDNDEETDADTSSGEDNENDDHNEEEDTRSTEEDIDAQVNANVEDDDQQNEDIEQPYDAEHDDDANDNEDLNDVQESNDGDESNHEESIDEESQSENAMDADVEEHDGNRPVNHPEWGDLNNFALNPPLPPIIGATILYYNWPNMKTMKARIETTFKTVQAKNPGWFNITNEGAPRITSIKMDVCRWKYADRIDVDDLDLSSDSTASDVVELDHSRTIPNLRVTIQLEQDEPPPLPPRSVRSTSVINCSSQTCKPKK